MLCRGVGNETASLILAFIAVYTHTLSVLRDFVLVRELQLGLSSAGCHQQLGLSSALWPALNPHSKLKKQKTTGFGEGRKVVRV